MYSEDLKSRAINLYYKFNSFRKVGDLLLISKLTIHRWIMNSTRKVKQKLDIKYMTSFVEGLLKNNKFISIKDIRNKINKKFNKLLSLSFIHTFISKTLKFSYKKINNKLFNKSLLSLKSKQRKFTKNIKKIPINNIISIDETYIYTNYTKNYGWSKIGTNLQHYKKSNPIKYSILMAISNNKIIDYEIHKVNINKVIFNDFMDKLNKKFTNYYFFLFLSEIEDNVSFHKSQLLNDHITNGNKLLFIPPYSSEFNPIEMVFSQMKRNLDRVTKKNIIGKIKKSLKLVTSNNLNNYYKNCFL